MSTKQVFTNQTGNATSLVHTHDTGHEWCYVHISGTMDGVTVTPYVTIGTLPAVALDSISWTVVDVNRISLGKGDKIDVRTTGAGGSTDISVEIKSPDAG